MGKGEVYPDELTTHCCIHCRKKERPDFTNLAKEFRYIYQMLKQGQTKYLINYIENKYNFTEKLIIKDDNFSK